MPVSGGLAVFTDTPTIANLAPWRYSAMDGVVARLAVGARYRNRGQVPAHPSRSGHRILEGIDAGGEHPDVPGQGGGRAL